ncbi:MAG: hypothetical protein KBH06_10585, partial [Spirochaetes bacterium]|nr:hypothetical protein [Spirochaetota bacterium]
GDRSIRREAGVRNSPDKPRAAVPFSFVHFFWATQKKWTNGLKRCGAPFEYARLAGIFDLLHETMRNWI